MKLITGFMALTLMIAPIALAQNSPSSGANAKTAEAKPSTETHPADWAPRQYVELWNNGTHGMDEMQKIFYPATIMHTHGQRIQLNPMMLAGVIRAWRTSMPDLHFTIEDSIVSGNQVVLRLSFKGTYKKVLFANTVNPDKFSPPSRVRSTEILIFNLRDGKIAEIWEEYDEVEMRILMGGRWCAETRPMAPEQNGPLPAMPPAAAPAKP